jgi:hypothetical protein
MKSLPRKEAIFTFSKAMRTFAIALFLFLVEARGLDLSNAVLVAPNKDQRTKREENAIRMLVEEVEKRSRINLLNNSPAAGGSKIILQTHDASLSAAESFKISVQGNSVTVSCKDERGLFFGVGRLLRELRLSRDSISIPDNFEITSSPKFPLRGHQLGYRPKTHSYDAWDLKTWEQYYRDLIVFGCNSIELIPPRSDDDADSPHFPLPPMRMMSEMSQLADDYALDVWIWYPAMDKDYSDAATVERALAEWAEVFSKLPRVDAVFVPGGDPGHTQPKYLMGLLEKQTANLHKYHPKAQMWVSPQGFTQAWMDEFLEILNRDQPAWLTGLVYGPQVRLPLAKLRSLAPKKYPIRDYPDITHTRQCQFPVPEWDVAYAITEGRECINPRPIDYTTIARANLPFTTGFITYSEGCNDDVNKAIWSALGWDPNAKPEETLRQYSRYFIGPEYEIDFTEGLLALEKNWRGPLATNTAVDATLARFQKLEKTASPQTLRNWRFQQPLLRAYMDACVRHRLIHETKVEERALEELRVATNEISKRLSAAEAILDLGVIPEFGESKAGPEIYSPLRARINELGEALFQSIAMQLSVERYKAIGPDRGASLSTLDAPLNNRVWLKNRFKKIANTPVSEHLIEEILNWANPGPGGFYDDLGNPANQPHLLQGLVFSEDPSRMYSARSDFEEDLVFDSADETAGVPRRLSWMDHAESLYDTPLRMQYRDLDKTAHYKLRVIYGGDNRRKIRLVANNTVEIHPHLQRPLPYKLLEFEIPQKLTKDGQLHLRFEPEPGLGGNGRNTQVSEVWLIPIR